MGITRHALADALFPAVQQRVLALLFAHPERSFHSAELIRLARGGTGGVHRLLTRLADAGWLTVTAVGNQKRYRANAACPGFRELRGLVLATLATPATRPGRVRGRGAAGEREPERREPEERETRAPDTPPAPLSDGWKTW